MAHKPTNEVNRKRIAELETELRIRAERIKHLEAERDAALRERDAHRRLRKMAEGLAEEACKAADSLRPTTAWVSGSRS
jgi:hypothetical protein